MTTPQVGGMTKAAIEAAMKAARKSDNVIKPAMGWGKTLEDVIGVKLFYLSWEPCMTSFNRPGYIAYVVRADDRTRTAFKLLIDSVPCTEAIDQREDSEPFFATVHSRQSANGRRYFTYREPKATPSANRRRG